MYLVDAALLEQLDVLLGMQKKVRFEGVVEEVVAGRPRPGSIARGRRTIYSSMSTVKGFVSHQLYHSTPRVSCRTSTELQSLVALLSLSLSSEERMVITTIAPITLPHRLSPLCINHSRIPRSAPKSPRACCCCRSLSLRSRRICQGHAQAHPVSPGSTASHQSLIIHSINLLFIYSHFALRCIKLRVVQATVSSKDGCRQKCRVVVRVVRVVLLSYLFSLGVTVSPP